MKGGFTMSISSVKWKPIVRRVLLVLSPLSLILLLEVILRVGGFIWHDYSRYYLFYGFHNLVGRVGVSPWITDTGQYYKFPPRYVLRGAAGQSEETAAINNQGFRGPDFEPAKPAGTFRVICMGESSTFGFHNRDTETYPFQLEKLFQEQHQGVRVEVINAGFPYYNTGSILSLLKAELLGFKPDVLTVYSAYNDAAWPLHVGNATRVATWLQDHSMTYLVMKRTILTDEFVMKWQGRIARGLLRQNPSREAFEANTTQVVARYRRNVKDIIAIARSRGVPIILIKQPMTAKFNDILSGYSRSYEEEYRELVKKFNAKRDLSPVEYQLLSQHRVVEELEAIAREENVELVDNVALVDRNRRAMASYVHLTAAANLALAEALKEVIEKLLPRARQ
jgi:lysophospholipase L1-like esterase